MPSITASTLIPCLATATRRAPSTGCARSSASHRQLVVPGPDGTIAHAQLTLGGGMIMLGSVAKEGDYGQTDGPAGRDRRPPDPDHLPASSTTPTPSTRAPCDNGAMIVLDIADTGLRRPRLHLPRPRRPRVEHRHLRSLAGGGAMNDEQQVRDLIAAWLRETQGRQCRRRAGADGARRRVPGGRPAAHGGPGRFRQPACAPCWASTPSTRTASSTKWQWREIWRTRRTRLEVTVTSKHGGTPMRRSGHTLSIFRKSDGKWLLTRDANMLGSDAEVSDAF